MTTAETIALFDAHVVPNYNRTPVVLVRGEGSRVWDAEGRCYLDLFPGWGVNGLGHCHPRVVEAVRRQAGILLHVANNWYMEPQGILARHIAEKSFGGQCFFCNSGAEANEAAIKLARKHAGPGRFKIITAYGSFHGRTLTTVAATGQAKYHAGFHPLPPGFVHVPYDDPDVVAKVADEETCAVLVEPIQGEGGVNVPADDYLPRLRELCDQRGILLILDEVQTGVGRTGRWFAHQHGPVVPDMMTLSKALGGGLALGALVAKPQVAESLTPGSHACTFGGNPIACAGGIAAFEAIEEDGLLENARRIGEQIKSRLSPVAEELDTVREVRGMGCMLGLELTRPGADIVQRCMEEGLLINCTHERVLRMLPSMAATEAEIDEGMDILERVLTSSD
ncbi:MAG: aspartate aminotransferase family protein [Candidatus Brocadiia bacterium]